MSDHDLVPAHRLSTAHVGHEVLHVFTRADKGIFGFIPLVLGRPGRLVADFIAGRRKRYFNPLQFLLLLVGFATLLAKKLPLDAGPAAGRHNFVFAGRAHGALPAAHWPAGPGPALARCHLARGAHRAAGQPHQLRGE